MSANYQHAECMDCDFEKENLTNALALGKQHAEAKGHEVHWLQEIGGVYRG